MQSDFHVSVFLSVSSTVGTVKTEFSLAASLSGLFGPPPLFSAPFPPRALSQPASFVLVGLAGASCLWFVMTHILASPVQLPAFQRCSFQPHPQGSLQGSSSNQHSPFYQVRRLGILISNAIFPHA